MDKRCFKCGEYKSRSEFYAHPKMADGLLGKCKECAKRDAINNRRDKIEYYRQYDIDRYRYDEERRRANKESCRAAKKADPDRYRGYQNDWADRNKHKMKAHFALNNAVRDGRILKPKHCSICGESRESRFIHGHHHDYEKPLDVIWMCTTCHGLEHSTLTKRGHEYERGGIDNYAR